MINSERSQIVQTANLPNRKLHGPPVSLHFIFKDVIIKVETTLDYTIILQRQEDSIACR